VNKWVYLPLLLVGKVQAVPSFTLKGLGSEYICIYPPSNLVEIKEGKYFFFTKVTPNYYESRHLDVSLWWLLMLHGSDSRNTDVEKL
jgi:N12 class adenine-specific DNA methylase